MHVRRAPHTAVGGGDFCCISRSLSDSVLLDVESQRSVDFFRAFDGQQLLVIEGSRCQFILSDLLR